MGTDFEKPSTGRHWSVICTIDGRRTVISVSGRDFDEEGAARHVQQVTPTAHDATAFGPIPDGEFEDLSVDEYRLLDRVAIAPDNTAFVERVVQRQIMNGFRFFGQDGSAQTHNLYLRWIRDVSDVLAVFEKGPDLQQEWQCLGDTCLQLNGRFVNDADTREAFYYAIKHRTWWLTILIAQIDTFEIAQKKTGPDKDTFFAKPTKQTPSPQQQALRLFYSYSHQDEGLRDKLQAHLSLLKREGVIKEWTDRKITAGSDWKNQINANLDAADIVLLLVSSDFIASDYCFDIEMQKAMEHNNRGQSRVIPIILRPVDWHSAPFGSLQALPKDGQPVTAWQNIDDAFKNIAMGIRKVADELRRNHRPNSGATSLAPNDGDQVVAQLANTLPSANLPPSDAPSVQNDDFRYLVKEGEYVPFNERVTGRADFIYDFQIHVPFVALHAIKALVKVFQCSSDGSRRQVDEAEDLVTVDRPMVIPRTDWQLRVIQAKKSTALVELQQSTS